MAVWKRRKDQFCHLTSTFKVRTLPCLAIAYLMFRLVRCLFLLINSLVFFCLSPIKNWLFFVVESDLTRDKRYFSSRCRWLRSHLAACVGLFLRIIFLCFACFFCSLPFSLQIKNRIISFYIFRITYSTPEHFHHHSLWMGIVVMIVLFIVTSFYPIFELSSDFCEAFILLDVDIF